MEEKLSLLVEKLNQTGKTISTMESCTGGGVANAITNIEGASKIFKFSAVTYSNEYKIKMGVSKKVIELYTVYSIETAKEMSKCISNFSNSNYGIGITGKLLKSDQDNLSGDDDRVFISIYAKDVDKFYDYDISVYKDKRSENKDIVIEFVVDKLLEMMR